MLFFDLFSGSLVNDNLVAVNIRTSKRFVKQIILDPEKNDTNATQYLP